MANRRCEFLFLNHIFFDLLKIGRVLLHVDMALKQDPSLAGSFLKTLQKEPFTITSFMLGFLLSLSNSGTIN